MATLLISITSIGHITQILNEKHRIVNKKKAKEDASKIKLYVQNALRLLDQGMSSHSEVSFLPLYYSLLNLAKAQIIFNGRADTLEKNRSHGAQYYDDQISKTSFLNESIKIN
ncbi:MAG: hypothetical protein AAFP08_07225, partial [Bacteroidota bacterium]